MIIHCKTSSFSTHSFTFTNECFMIMFDRATRYTRKVYRSNIASTYLGKRICYIRDRSNFCLYSK